MSKSIFIVMYEHCDVYDGRDFINAVFETKEEADDYAKENNHEGEDYEYVVHEHQLGAISIF